jgi:hypothetical protein
MWRGRKQQVGLHFRWEHRHNGDSPSSDDGMITYAEMISRTLNINYGCDLLCSVYTDSDIIRCMYRGAHKAKTSVYAALQLRPFAWKVNRSSSLATSFTDIVVH